MSDTVTVTDLKLATRQREGFEEKLAHLQMKKTKNSRFMTQEEQKTQVQPGGNSRRLGILFKGGNS